MEQLTKFFEKEDIPFINDKKYVFACGFTFYQFEEKLACNNPKGNQFLELSISDAERLIKRQVRKVPDSLRKPFYRQ